jgi:hypothetical protein
MLPPQTLGETTSLPDKLTKAVSFAIDEQGIEQVKLRMEK